MPLPQHTQALLVSGPWILPGAVGEICEGNKFHSPTPLCVDYVPLIPKEWNVAISVAQAETGMWLCGVCRDNLSILQQIWSAHQGNVPWMVRREHGNSIRSMVSQAWDRYQEIRGAVA